MVRERRRQDNKKSHLYLVKNFFYYEKIIKCEGHKIHSTMRIGFYRARNPLSTYKSNTHLFIFVSFSAILLKGVRIAEKQSKTDQTCTLNDL